VRRAGANLSVGDGHGRPGDGEVCLNALEMGLTGTFTLILHPRGGAPPFVWPRAETPTHFITFGFNEDLHLAMKQALRA
jgi:acetamidase/formamidase